MKDQKTTQPKMATSGFFESLASPMKMPLTAIAPQSGRSVETRAYGEPIQERLGELGGTTNGESRRVGDVWCPCTNRGAGEGENEGPIRSGCFGMVPLLMMCGGEKVTIRNWVRATHASMPPIAFDISIKEATESGQVPMDGKSKG